MSIAHSGRGFRIRGPLRVCQRHGYRCHDVGVTLLGDERLQINEGAADLRRSGRLIVGRERSSDVGL